MVGVPANAPVAVLKLNPGGNVALFRENASVSPFGSLLEGVKLYDAPTRTVAVGVPEMVGG